jgi:hypothetical protein
LPLHGGEVIKEPMILTLSPLSSGGDGSFRETDRTCSGWLGLDLYVPVIALWERRYVSCLA